MATLIKTLGLSATLGMIGAALLYIVLPPVNHDGTFNKREFAARLAVAGVFSAVFGDVGVDVLNHVTPFLNPEKHHAAVEMLVGAPGWWVSRAVALWLQKQQNKDIAQIVKETRE